MNYAPLNDNNYRQLYDCNINENPSFEKYQETTDNMNYAKTAMNGDLFKACSTNKNLDEVGKIFFSKKNINRIQKLLKREIFNRTNGIFRLDTDQDESDLLIAMRAVYMEHARFVPNGTIRQVKKLNRDLIEYITPDMITQIKQAYSYVQEINRPLKPLTRPINVNNAGRRTLPSITTIWNA